MNNWTLFRWRSLFKVDILNIMGPSIAAAAWTWGLARSAAGKLLALALLVLLIPITTPYVRAMGWLGVLPDPIEAYVRPAGTFATFTFFPWSAFVFAGAAVGVVLERAANRRAESRRVWAITAAGAALAAAAYALSFLPSPFANSYFWTTSPAFFYLRTGIMLSAFGLAWIWSDVLWRDRWQPFVLLGQTSLFVYWVHVEVVYGYLTKPIYRRLPFWGSCLGVVLLTIVMYYLAKNAKGWMHRQRALKISNWKTRALTIMGI